MTPWSDTPNMAGQKGRSGPPLGNLNAARTGQSITRLTLGELPATMNRQTQQARKYRRGLEALVVDAKGQVDATDAHLIDEAAGAEVHAAVCRWLLRTRIEKMSVSDVTRCSEQIVKARAARNRAVERLRLMAKNDPWALDVPVQEIDDGPEIVTRPPRRRERLNGEENGNGHC